MSLGNSKVGVMVLGNADDNAWGGVMVQGNAGVIPWGITMVCSGLYWILLLFLATRLLVIFYSNSPNTNMEFRVIIYPITCNIIFHLEYLLMSKLLGTEKYKNSQCKYKVTNSLQPRWWIIHDTILQVGKTYN